MELGPFLRPHRAVQDSEVLGPARPMRTDLGVTSTTGSVVASSGSACSSSGGFVIWVRVGRGVSLLSLNGVGVSVIVADCSRRRHSHSEHREACRSMCCEEDLKGRSFELHRPHTQAKLLAYQHVIPDIHCHLHMKPSSTNLSGLWLRLMPPGSRLKGDHQAPRTPLSVMRGEVGFKKVRIVSLDNVEVDAFMSELTQYGGLMPNLHNPGYTQTLSDPSIAVLDGPEPSL